MSEKRNKPMNYKLESFCDRSCRKRDTRLSLSAHDDSQAVQQMRCIGWRHDCAGESRMLILSRKDGSEWVEVTRMGTRRYG